MAIQDKLTSLDKAIHISNLSENACPFPELALGRGAQWCRILSKLRELGITVIETEELKKLNHWAGI
jgi:hypothetical protein